MIAHCGLVSSSARCSCARRVRPAVARGRVSPDRLLFAGQGTRRSRPLPVLEAVGEMERLHEIAAIHQGHPAFAAPQRVSDTVQRVLESANVRVLLDGRTSVRDGA